MEIIATFAVRVANQIMKITPHKMLNIVLFGAPGAGKGTQAEKLTRKYNLNHISTGEVIRAEIASGSELGASMKDYIARGEFAPDSLVVDMISDYLGTHNSGNGNIFDGFPRNIVQAEEFDVLMDKHNMHVDMMLSLEVPNEELVRRLLNRGKDSGRADDCSRDVIMKRIRIYEETTAVVSEYYAEQGKHIAIDGTGTMEEIFDRLCATLDKYI